MKILILCCLLTTGCLLRCYSQYFQKTYGAPAFSINNFGNQICRTLDQGYFFAAVDAVNHGFYCTRLDSIGSIKWSYQIRDSSENWSIYPDDILALNDHVFLITGTRTAGPLLSNLPFLLRIDSNGNIIWMKYYSLQPGKFAKAIESTNGFIITGNSNSSGLICNFDMNGDILWAKTINGISEFNSLSATSDGNYIALGSDFAHQIVIKFDSSGHILWLKSYNGHECCLGHPTPCIVQLTDGNYLFNSLSWDTSFQTSHRFFEIDSVGKPVRSLTVSSSQNLDFGNFIKLQNNEIAESGSYGNYLQDSITNAMIYRFSSTGEIISSRSFGYSDYSNDNYSTYLSRNNDNGFSIFGVTQLDTTFDQHTALFLFKTDSTGSIKNGCVENDLLLQSTVSSFDTIPVIYNEVMSGIAASSLPYVISSNGLMEHDLCSIINSAFTLKTREQILVYPNPFASEISITFRQNADCVKFAVYDVLGRTLFMQQQTNFSISNTKIIDLNFLPEGMYLLETNTDGKCASTRLIKN